MGQLNYQDMAPQDVIDLMAGRIARLEHEIYRAQELLQPHAKALLYFTEWHARPTMLRREELVPTMTEVHSAASNLAGLLYEYAEAEEAQARAKERRDAQEALQCQP